jgi:hypothetical protein
LNPDALLDQLFGRDQFTFRFPGGARDVRIRMIYSGTAVWIFVTPIAA